MVPLPAELRAPAEQYLPGVIGEPVPAFTLSSDMAAIREGTRIYTVVNRTGNLPSETHEISRGEDPGYWRYTVGNRMAFLHEVPGESVSLVSEQDTKLGVVTHFNPAQPLLIAGMNAGDSRKLKLAIQIYDLDDVQALKYRGSVDLIMSYVGAYKVTVPAGTFDAALLRWTYRGKIGPAKIEETQVRLVAKDAGVVAAADRRDVAAVMLYNATTKTGKVLRQR